MTQDAKELLVRTVEIDDGRLEFHAWENGITTFWAFDKDDTVYLIFHANEFADLLDAIYKVRQAHNEYSKQQVEQEIEALKAEYEERYTELRDKIRNL